MSLRAALLAVLLAAPLGCASAPTQTQPSTGKARTTTGRGSRQRVRVVAPTMTTRPSEQEPVLEEVPDPEAQRLFTKRLEDPAVTLARAGSPPKVTEIALADTARGEAAGMMPADDVMEAKLTEGQRAMMAVTLAPYTCTTFIAQGGLGVIEVDLFLVAADRSDGVRILAQDPGVGPIAVVGGRGHCYLNPRSTPIAAELHTTMRRGSGVVLVREYRKK
ncbi:MAG: hypothetical protein QM820_44750 [Minicystis sp.]